jgi:tetratricopeptide (TPR) repeat protein
LALRYGVSYSRWLFLELGYFPPGLRVAEDSAFNTLVRSRYVIDWAPDVLTTHRYPTHLWGLLRDQFARGQRRGALPNFAPGAIKTEKWAQVRAATRERLDAALAAVHHLETTSGVQGSTLRALLHLTSWTDALGTVVSLQRRARADLARQEAISRMSSDPESAVQHLRKAIALNPQDVDLRLNLATALAASGKPKDLRRARRACLQAADIAPAALRPLNHLCDLLMERGQVEQALAQAEAAVARSPSIGPFWAKASALALRQGDLMRALFYGQGALALGPAVPYAHLRLARVYRQLGLRDRESWRARWAETLK